MDIERATPHLVVAAVVDAIEARATIHTAAGAARGLGAPHQLAVGGRPALPLQTVANTGGDYSAKDYESWKGYHSYNSRSFTCNRTHSQTKRP